jgi:hypothetical protein
MCSRRSLASKEALLELSNDSIVNIDGVSMSNVVVAAYRATQRTELPFQRRRLDLKYEFVNTAIS